MWCIHKVILIYFIVILLMYILREMTVFNIRAFDALITNTYQLTLHSMSRIVVTRWTKILWLKQCRASTWYSSRRPPTMNYTNWFFVFIWWFFWDKSSAPLLNIFLMVYHGCIFWSIPVMSKSAAPLRQNPSLRRHARQVLEGLLR